MTRPDDMTVDEHDDLRHTCPACGCTPCAGTNGRGSCDETAGLDPKGGPVTVLHGVRWTAP